MLPNNKAEKHPSPDQQQAWLDGIGGRLEKVAAKNGYNLATLAKKAGINHQAIYNISKSAAVPGASTLIKLKALIPELDLNWLLSGEDVGKKMEEEIQGMKATIKEQESIIAQLRSKLNKAASILVETYD